MKRLVLLLTFLSVPALVHAQPAITTTSTFGFISPDHTTTIPAGQTHAGQPTVDHYQFSLFPTGGTGTPISVGAPVLKSVATPITGTNPQQYAITVAGMGLTGNQAIPACSTLPCPQYQIVMVAIGPNGTSTASPPSTPPFTAVLPVQGPPPASPSGLVVVTP